MIRERLEPKLVAGASLPETLRILMPSIVNPREERNGAAAVTRGLLKTLACAPLNAHVDCLPARDRPRRWHSFAQACSLLLSSVSDLPAKAAFLYSKEFRERVVSRVRSEPYDLVILNGADLLWISDDIPASIPRILVAHNIEHLLFATQIETLGWLHRPLKGLLRKDCARLKAYELNGIRESRNVIFLSREEAAYAGTFCERLRPITMPPVFDYDPRPRPRTKPGPTLEIGFLGNFRWWPNQLSLRWFADQVLPYVKSPLRINLFGHRGPRGWRNDVRIVEHGVVGNIEQVWASCDILICPAFASGGVCVKFAEAVYNGMPVLATRQAARGLSVDDDPAIVLLDEPGEWVEFLNSPAARDLAGKQVLRKTTAVFAIDTHKARLQEFVRGALSSPAALGAEA